MRSLRQKQHRFVWVCETSQKSYRLLARAGITRTNSVNQDPLNWPIPPLDLFVDTYPTSATRPEPLFLYAQEVPYKSYAYQTVNIDPPGNGAHSRGGGNHLLGMKWNLLSEDDGAALGLGIRPYVTLPGETPLNGERNGAISR